ncbi:MAG: hypothetical protein IPJ77_19475 [Planctomycetes bacterium]|nr:hypothetical protein [Planctomycetota bacterium]
MQSADNQGGSPTGSQADAGGRPAGTRGLQPQNGQGPTAWSSDGAAADFLGLDQEVAAFPGTAGAADPAQGGTASVDGSHSWLLSLEGEAAPSAGTAAPVTPETLLESELPPADERSAPETAEETPAPSAPARRRSRAPLYALAACGVLAAGGWFGWQWWQGQSTPTETVATNPTPPAPAKPKAKPTNPKAGAGTTTKTPRTTPSTTTTTEPGTVASGANPTATTDPTATTTTEPAPEFAFGTRASDGRVAGFLSAHQAQSSVDELAPTDGHATVPPLSLGAPGFGLATEQVPSDAEPTIDEATAAASIPEPEPEADAGPRRVVRGRTSRSALRFASDEDLAGVWEANTIPLDAIEKDARLLTPAVGRVRITIHGGELFEGRLYALGQRLVWLDTDLGRMALASHQVQRIEHLSSPDGTPRLGSSGSQALAGLPRMRVRAPGGMLYGRVIGRDDRSVTLITDTGARITIDTTEIEPAPEKRSLIVRGAEKPAPGS